MNRRDCGSKKAAPRRRDDCAGNPLPSLSFPPAHHLQTPRINYPSAPTARVKTRLPRFGGRLNLVPVAITREKSIIMRHVSANADPRLVIPFFKRYYLLFHAGYTTVPVRFCESAQKLSHHSSSRNSASVRPACLMIAFSNERSTSPQ